MSEFRDPNVSPGTADSQAKALIATSPRCPLLAQSGHWFGRRACPLLGVKQTSLVRDRVSVNDPRVDLEENRHVFLIRPSLLRIMISLLLELGRNPSKPLRCKRSSAGCEGIVPAIGPNHPAIPQIAGRDGWLQTASTATV